MIPKLSNRWERERDAFAECTGICVVHDSLKHPGTEDVVTLKVPGYRQVASYTCGFAAGLMVLHTFHPGASIDDFYHRVRPHPRDGASTRKVTDALRQSGVGVSVRNNLSFAGIRREIAAGFPIITCIKTDDPDVEHWVVVYGYGTEPKRLFIAGNGWAFLNPQPREIHWDSFARLVCAKGFGLVCWGKEC